jgi:hypothetical protein
LHPALTESHGNPQRWPLLPEGETYAWRWLVWHLLQANWNICVVAPSLEQAHIIFCKAEYHFTCRILAGFVSGTIKLYTFPVIQLKNGVTITAPGANSPQFIRGNGFHLLVRERLGLPWWSPIVVRVARARRVDAASRAVAPTSTMCGGIRSQTQARLDSA